MALVKIFKNYVAQKLKKKKYIKTEIFQSLVITFKLFSPEDFITIT